MKFDTKTIQKVGAALTSALGVVTAFGLLSPAHATAVTAAIAALAAIWEPTPPAALP